MRIGYVCHQFFPDCYTGTERYTLELAKQIQRMGHYACVLTYALNELAGNVRTRRGVSQAAYDYEGVPVIALRHCDLASKGGLPGISFDLRDALMLEEIDRLLTEQKFDIVHSVHPMRMGSALGAAKKRAMKVVLTLMDFWMICPRVILLRPDGSLCNGPDHGHACAELCFQENGMAERLLKRHADNIEALGMADAIVSHSRFLIDAFTKSGVDTRRFIHCPNGFDYAKIDDTKRKEATRETISLGFIGTLLPHKGVDVLVDAFKQVPASNLRLRIYGGHLGAHEYYSSLRTKVDGDNRITFCGDYDYNNIARVLDEIDIVVVPSLWYENAPLVIGAAQAFGIPVIATRIGGMKELVTDGVNGLTFSLGDANELADKIRLVATNPSILKELGKNKLPPPRIESEAFLLETLYYRLLGKSLDLQM